MRQSEPAPRDTFHLLEPAPRGAPGAEGILQLPIGAYAAFGDPLAELRASPVDDVAELAETVVRAAPPPLSRSVGPRAAMRAAPAD